MWKPAVRKKKGEVLSTTSQVSVSLTTTYLLFVYMCPYQQTPWRDDNQQWINSANKHCIVYGMAVDNEKKNCLSFLSVSCGRQQEGCVFCQCNWNTQAKWVRHLHYTHILPIVWNQRNITLTQWWRFIMCFGYSPGDTLDPNNTG